MRLLAKLGTVVLLLGLLIIVVPPSAVSAQLDPPVVDSVAIDDYVEEQMEAAGIPGLSVAVVAGNQLVYAGGYGEADPDGRPVTAQTPFMIGSTTKAMTAIAIMQLVESGQLELDTPVQEYLPYFRTADPNATGQISVRHLLQHTSGFSTFTGRTGMAASDLSDDAIENAVRSLNDTSLAYSPGERHEYSNTNYDILGLVVQSVSGQSYESYLQAHLFEPLDMTHSFTSQQAAIVDGLARGYVSWFGLSFARDISFNRGHLPSGYVMASAEDMGHYLIAQLNGGRFDEINVLSPAAMAETHESVVATDVPDESHAMGWVVDTSTGDTIIYHSGANMNYSTHIRMLAQQELGVVVLTNTNGLTALAGAPEQIATGIMASVRGQEPEPYETPGYMRLVVGSVVVVAGLAMLRVVGSVIWFLRRRPRRSPMGIALPLVMDLLLLWAVLFGIPLLWQVPLGQFPLAFPDMATLMFVGAAAVAVWAVVRTALLAGRPQSPALLPTVEPVSVTSDPKLTIVGGRADSGAS